MHLNTYTILKYARCASRTRMATSFLTYMQTCTTYNETIFFLNNIKSTFTFLHKTHSYLLVESCIINTMDDSHEYRYVNKYTYL